MSMMNQIKIASKNNSYRYLHKEIMNVLFLHKNEIFNKFLDLRGMYFLDHISIILFSPDNEVLIFSITPSVEYNLLLDDLWKEDIAFTPKKFSSGTLAWWDQNSSKLYPEIKRIKETNHNFTLGFNLYKSLGKFRLVYSFATKRIDPNLREYYTNNKDKIFLLGDYSFKLIRNIYQKYCPNHELPVTASNITHPKQSYLKLISNNVADNHV